MGVSAARSRSMAMCLLLVMGIAGCASSRHEAPVLTRDPSTGSGGTTEVTPPVDPGPGYYVVKPGDTLTRIALATGVGWRDISRWNNMTDPNVIEVGTVLRVAPPDGSRPASSTVVAGEVPTATVPATGVQTQPVLPSAASSPAPAPASPVVAPAAASSPAATSTPPAPAPTRSMEGDDGIDWMWPASGPVVARFDDVKNKGLAIAGKAGDPVFAAADGRVVYAGSGLRGYGNLVIVKHNATYLTAYAHNQALLVKEDQVVRKGQKIAEMGSSDSDRVQLHFEIRKQGKPIDPSGLLPPR